MNIISSVGICPSNTLVHGIAFPNYAGRSDVDELLKKELTDAGIEIVQYDFLKDRDREVKTSIMGQVGPWGFDRAWYYWVAKGPGIPPEYAKQLYASHGQEARIEGHCGCPDELYNKGFAIGTYHVDTANGLKALADTIKQVMSDAKAKQGK
jgi:hypothetical protein